METTMCIHWKGGKLGCAYYSIESLTLYVMEDIKEQKDFDYTTMLIAQILPKQVILSKSSDELVFNFFQEEYGTSIELIKMSPKNFSFEKGRYMLLNWYINHLEQTQEPPMYDNTEAQDDVMDNNQANQNIFMLDPEEGCKTQAYLRLEGLIELETSTLTIGCAGALLKHLQNTELEDMTFSDEEEPQELNELSVQPVALKSFSCEQCMHVNSDTIKSLSIFDHETHPNMHQKRAKESLSLFGLLNKTTSVLGKQMLHEWVSRPTRNKDTLDYRHEAISFFMRSNTRETIHDLSSSLKNIKNINRLIARVTESKASINDWNNILKFAYYSIRIFGILSQLNTHGSHIGFIKKAMHFMPGMDHLKTVQSLIHHLIDFETSQAEGRVIIQGGIDTELDELRQKYEQLDNFLFQVSQEISAALPVELGTTLNVVYFPQLGYLVTLPQRFQKNSARVTRDSGAFSSDQIDDYYQRFLTGFELQFTTTDNKYYKNDRIKELDEHVGDIHTIIADKEIEIVQQLSKNILQYATLLTETVEILSELDCLISLTVVALKCNYVKPVMILDDSLMISQGRHPLQELCVDIFIPNDTNLRGGRGFKSGRQGNESDASNASIERSTSSPIHDPYHLNTGDACEDTLPTGQSNATEYSSSANDDTNSVQVVTGANFSGKSVYLKQVALIVYMAHIGSFVPANHAVIGITDKLFTRIQTSETVSKPQSAFAFDIQQIGRALQGATSHSLVIIDEFGKGTDSADGEALFCSVIGYYLSKGDACPKIVASTHFHDLISQDILTLEDGITLSQTEMMSSKSNSGDDVVFLYRVVPGSGSSASHGIKCAGMAGLPSSTLQRAAQLSQAFINNQPIEKIQSKAEEEYYNQLEIIRDKFLSVDLKDIDLNQLLSAVEMLQK